MKRELEPYQLIERSIIKKYRKSIWNRFVGGVKDYHLIEEGDRIAVCISGGKDSMLLAKYPKVRINSPENAIPHILNLSVQDVKGTVFQRELNEEGVCVSVKSACSSDGLPSRAVFAVSRDRRNALSSWRVSLSHRTTEEDLRGFLAAFDRCYRGLTETK